MIGFLTGVLPEIFGTQMAERLAIDWVRKGDAMSQHWFDGHLKEGTNNPEEMFDDQAQEP